MVIKKGSIGNYVKAWQQFLINQDILYSGQDDGIFGPKTEAATLSFQSENGIMSDGVVGPETITKAIEFGFVEPQPEQPNDKISMEQLSYIMKSAKRGTLELHLPFINDCMKMFEINTTLRKQHFLAQCGHESCSLMYMHEIASGSAYEGRRDLGNIYPGDGKKFRGHGPIQLTGRLNHQAFFDYIGRPELIDTPEILESDLGLAWKASGWFWMSRNINRAADQDNVVFVTKLVNGGLNGLDDRKQYLSRAKEVIPGGGVD